MSIVPKLPEITREAFTVILGAILAAAIVSQFPAIKQWIKEQWA